MRTLLALGTAMSLFISNGAQAAIIKLQGFEFAIFRKNGTLEELGTGTLTVDFDASLGDSAKAIVNGFYYGGGILSLAEMTPLREFSATKEFVRSPL